MIYKLCRIVGDPYEIIDKPCEIIDEPSEKMINRMKSLTS